ncbi:MAG: type II secretion system F family protein [Acutalibacteraceae bacterium]
MFFTAFDIAVIIIGYLVLGVWLFFWFKGRKYSELFEDLDETEFRFKELYSIGYAVLETFHYKYHSNSDRKLRRQAEVLYGAKYADYFLRVVHSQQISMGMTLLVFAFVAYGLTSEKMILLVLIGIAGLIYYNCGTLMKKKIDDRSEEILGDFAEVISKLALLTNAGMILKEAWEVTAYGGETELYLEMQKAVEDMNNGMSEVDAYHEFGKRCVIPEIKKFAVTVIQGVTKGSSELVMMLQNQSKEVWNTKKQSVKAQGEKAASKLLLPMVIMFVGILLMIIIPIFSNLGV